MKKFTWIGKERKMATITYQNSPTSPSYSLTETTATGPGTGPGGPGGPGPGTSTYKLVITYPAGGGTEITVPSIPSANVLTANGTLVTGGPAAGDSYVIPPTITGTIDINNPPPPGTDTVYVGGTATLNSSTA